MLFHPNNDGEWRYFGLKPKRDISTVVLEEAKKKSILDDARSYLSSRSWYDERGIPYRRGYLLYGPPGTGKTSLATALANEFGLPIYSVSLNDSNIGEEAFAFLLSRGALPSQCLVLLEDVDLAGLQQNSNDTNQGTWHFTHLTYLVSNIRKGYHFLVFSARLTAHTVKKVASLL
jgi:mitochondrial chaperone BCS1